MYYYKGACPMYEDRMNGETHFVSTSNKTAMYVNKLCIMV